MPRFSGTPEEPTKGGRFGGKLEVATEAAAPEMVPSYDPMGVATGYSEAAPSTPAKPMTYGEQMGKVGEFYGAVGRGAVKGALGTPGELEYLGAYALPNYLAKKFPKAVSATPEKDQVQIFPRAETVGKMMEEVGLGKTPEQLKGAEFIGELVGGLKGYGARPVELGAKTVRTLTSSPLQEALKTVQFTGEQLAAAAKRSAGERLTSAEEKLLNEAVSAVDRQMTRISGLKEVTEKVAPEVEQMQTAARSETKLAAPETSAELAAKKDVNSVIRNLADQKYGSAEKFQKEIGGQAFEDYKLAANVKQAAQAFGESIQGKALQKELDTIIGGGTGDLRKFGKAEIDIAREIRTELFGRRAEDISLKEVEDVASRLPKSFSQAARETQARNMILEREARGRRPVDFQLVDNKLRELRQTEASKLPEAATAIAKGRYGSAADRVENALKEWVGPENYPRETYAKASEALNRFRTRLGEALTAREEIPYATEEGMRELARPANILFESRESVNFGKQLLGDAEVNSLAEKFASNQLANKDADAIVKWLKDPKNEFVYEVPSLSEKLTQYGQALASREGDAKAFSELQKQAAKKIAEAKTGISEAKGVAETATAEAQKSFETAQKSADELTRALQNEDPAKLYSSFTKMRPKLEETGVFDKSALDALEANISKASKIADAKERRDAIVGAVFGLIKRVGTLGLLK
jgi:hypothetical protein